MKFKVTKKEIKSFLDQNGLKVSKTACFDHLVLEGEPVEEKPLIDSSHNCTCSDYHWQEETHCNVHSPQPKEEPLARRPHLCGKGCPCESPQPIETIEDFGTSPREVSAIFQLKDKLNEVIRAVNKGKE